MPTSATLQDLVSLLSGRRLVVLTGAGCSTESGIPDYRGTDHHERTPAPIRYGEFVRSRAARRRYWARSAVGWPRMAGARPNPGHEALARLERAGLAAGVITQNVDGLHQAAGTHRLVELHGSLDRVVCLECGGIERRGDVQERLLALNPGWARRVRGRSAARTGADGQPLPGVHGRPGPEGDGDLGREADADLRPDGDADLRPDGDADLGDADVTSFRLPGCRRCGGVLKPDVVFFGENVPRATVEEAWGLFGQGEALLVAGSSLAVYSGYRFVRRADEAGVPVAIVNLGSTRGDPLARVRLDGRTGQVLPRLAGALLAAADLPAPEARARRPA